MHRRLKHILLCGVVLSALICLFCFSASAFTYEGSVNDVNLSTYSINIGGTTLPLSEYPDGGWYDPEKRYMTASEAAQYGLSGSVDLRGWECMGFARYVYTALYRRYPANATMDTCLAAQYGGSYFYRDMVYEVFGTKGQLTNFTASDLKKLVTSCYPGTVMRYGTSSSGHSMVIMSIFDDGFIVYDANFSYDDEIDIRKYTWESYVAKHGSRGINAMQIPSYYPGYTDSLGRSGGGAYDYELDETTAGTYRVTVSSYLNVRSGPGTSNSIVGKAYNGDEYEVMGSYNGWAAINYNGAYGWLSLDYLELVELALKADGYLLDVSAAGKYEVCNTAKVNIRALPTTSSTDLGDLYKGTVIDVLGFYGEWAAFIYNGEDCWVYTDYLTPYVKKLTVEFDANGGVASETSRTYEIGATFGELPTAEKTDRILLGWYSGTTKYTAGSTAPDADALVLKAKWGVCGYVDVDEDSWYAPYVERGQKMGIISVDTEYNPERASLRAEFVTVISRIFANETGEDISAYSSENFLDVRQDQYYAAPIGWAYAYGVVNGESETQFSPETPITREQIATILYRYACMMGVTDAYTGASYLGNFNDGDQVSDYAKTAINWAVHNGIMTGDTEGYLEPQDSAERSEMVTLAVRFVEFMKN